MHQLRDDDREVMQAEGILTTEKEFREKALRVQTRTLNTKERKRARDAEAPGPSSDPLTKRTRTPDADKGSTTSRSDNASTSAQSGRWSRGLSTRRTHKRLWPL